METFFAPEDSERFKKKLAEEGFGGAGRLFLYETALQNREKQKIPVQVSASWLLDGDRQDGLVCFFRDLRQIRKLEREMADQARILHQDKMMSLGRLAASMVHEINNPLAGILNYVRLMLRIIQRGPLTESGRDKFLNYLQLVESETHRCSQIVSSLLTFSRKSKPAKVPIQAVELLQRCILLSRHKLELSNIALHTNIAPVMPQIRGDFNQLQQCIINLIFNAIDAMPEGGRLTISAGLDNQKGRVAVEVADTGPGISPENIPHIFEPFFTTKEEGYGVGLGLSTVYGIIQHHGGSVRVVGGPGEGTRFILELPAE